MTVDVSLVVGASHSRVESMTGKQSLRSLEIVARLSDASGTWVMFVRDVDSLDRHATKNLLLAAEGTDATLAMGGAHAEIEVLTVEQLQLRSPLIDVHGVLFNRKWLQSRLPLSKELAEGVRELAPTTLGAVVTIALIPQATIAGPPPQIVDGSKAVVQAGPVSRLAGLAFSVACVLPLSTRMVIDVDGSRAVDSALTALSHQWRAQHRKVPVVVISENRGNSWRHAWQLGRARWVVTNERFISRLPKRDGQQLVVAAVEVPLVRSGRDNPDWVLQPTSERRPSRSQVERWDLAVTSGPFATQVLRSSSGYAGPVLEGVCVFADAMTAASSETDLRGRLDLEPSLPLVLIALRSAQTQLNIESLTQAFAERLQFVVVTDDLSKVDAQQAFDDLPSWCAAADLMVTEWSSLTMEFGSLQRPILAFQADAVEVVRRRGTYADLPEVLPGPCVGSTGELIERLEHWLAQGDQAWPEFAERSATFATLGCRSTGDAAVRILEAIEGLR